MSLEHYYFDIAIRQWVRSFDEPFPIDPPVWGNTDSRDFGVTFLMTTGAQSAAVLIAVVGASIHISDPATPGTVITSVTAGAAANNEFPFVLAITGFTTFLSGKTTPQRAIAEFRIVTASGVNRYGTEVYIRPNQSTDVTADTSAADRALGTNEAAGVYVAKEWPAGGFMIVQDETDGSRYQVRVVNKQFKFEPLG